MAKQHRTDQILAHKAALEARHGLVGHPRADALFDLALEYGYAIGDEEGSSATLLHKAIEGFYGEMAGLLPTVGIESEREAIIIRAALKYLEMNLGELYGMPGPLLEPGLAHSVLERHEVLALLEKLKDV